MEFIKLLNAKRNLQLNICCKIANTSIDVSFKLPMYVALTVCYESWLNDGITAQ